MIEPEPEVIHEDNHLLVVNKPPGMLSQGDRTGDPSILDWGKASIKARHGKPGNVFLALVHRLDRPTSGVMVLARTSKAASRLSDAVRRRRFEKRYWAILERPPEPEADELVDLLRSGRGGGPTEVVPSGTAGRTREAVLRYRTLGETELGALVEVDLETGRKHQIRAQLAHRGWPVAGDRRYGARRGWMPGRIALHARALTLPHPVGGGTQTFVADPPTDWPTLPRPG